MYVCMYVYMYVCMYVCINSTWCSRLHLHIHAIVHLHWEEMREYGRSVQCMLTRVCASVTAAKVQRHISHEWSRSDEALQECWGCGEVCCHEEEWNWPGRHYEYFKLNICWWPQYYVCSYCTLIVIQVSTLMSLHGLQRDLLSFYNVCCL